MGFDIIEPSKEEFAEMAHRYNLHPALENDCLEPDHLPKFERMQHYSFILFRICSKGDTPEVENVQDLTSTIAMFFCEKFILTIHRKKQSLFEHVIASMEEKMSSSSKELLNILIASCLNTYEDPLKNCRNLWIIMSEWFFLNQKMSLC